MFVIGYKTTYDNRYSVSSIVYPTLEMAQKALEVKQFESVLKFQIFSLSPVADSSPSSPKTQEESHA